MKEITSFLTDEEYSFRGVPSKVSGKTLEELTGVTMTFLDELKEEPHLESPSLQTLCHLARFFKAPERLMIEWYKRVLGSRPLPETLDLCSEVTENTHTEYKILQSRVESLGRCTKVVEGVKEQYEKITATFTAASAVSSSKEEVDKIFAFMEKKRYPLTKLQGDEKVLCAKDDLEDILTRIKRERDILEMVLAFLEPIDAELARKFP